MKICNNTLIIFLKYPQAGKVKTRLAQSIGDSKAVEIYKKLVHLTLKQTKSKNYQQLIYFSPKNKKEEIRLWLEGQEFFFPQRGENLGERLSDSFKNAFKLGAKKVVVIGTDCPFVDKNNIQEAFLKLEKNDAVIGPTEDGGYYLLGLKLAEEQLFENVPWSSCSVFDQTIDILTRLNFQFDVLKKYRDLDTIEDLVEVQKVFKTLIFKKYNNL